MPSSSPTNAPSAAAAEDDDIFSIVKKNIVLVGAVVGGLFVFVAIACMVRGCQKADRNRKRDAAMCEAYTVNPGTGGSSEGEFSGRRRKKHKRKAERVRLEAEIVRRLEDSGGDVF